MPINLSEAIFILLTYNFYLGLLSSAVIATSGAGSTGHAVRFTPQSVGVTAEMVQDISEKATKSYDNQNESLYCESIAPETQEQSDNIQSCFSSGFDSTFKAYMDYRCITDTNSVQYSLQQQAYTDGRGFRRIGDDYCVALGTGITNGCGERFLITLDSGYSFTAIVSDVKADIHTDSTHCYAPRGDNSGNIVEFIIDTDNADGYMLTCGSAGCFEDLSGNVISIERI